MGLSGHADPAAVLGVGITFTIIQPDFRRPEFWKRRRLHCSSMHLDRLPHNRPKLPRCAASNPMLMFPSPADFELTVKYGMGCHIDTLSEYDLATSFKPFGKF
jgi:hypothetical protein